MDITHNSNTYDNQTPEQQDSNDSTSLKADKLQIVLPVQKRRGLRHAVRIVERDLWQWYLAQNERVTKNHVQLRARYIFQQAGISNFKASDGWYKRWMRRWRQYKCESGIGSLNQSNSTSLEKQCGGNNTTSETTEQSSNVVDTSSEGKPSVKQDVVVAPSFGDTLDSTFPCLEISRLPMEEEENCVLSRLRENSKDDAKLTTPQHNGFEAYSLESKVLKLQDCKKRTGSDGDFNDNAQKIQDKGSEEEQEEDNKMVADSNTELPPEDTVRQERVQRVARRYHSHFKERVLSYLRSHTCKETARKFKVHRGSVSAWQRDKLRLKLMDGRGAVSSAPSVPVDVQFIRWLRARRGLRLSAAEVGACARRLVALAGGIPVLWRQVPWFALWADRLEEKPLVDAICPVTKEDRRFHYPVAFRNEVAAYAAKFSQMAAVCTFHVSRKRVFEWLQASQGTQSSAWLVERAKHPSMQVLKNAECGRKQSGTGKSVTDPQVDQLVWQWYCDSQNEKYGGGRLPTSHEVRSHAAALYSQHGLSSRVRCSYGWYRRWCERFGVLRRHVADDQLLSWALARVDRHLPLSHGLLQEQARQLWTPRCPDFKASPGWAIRFCKRHPMLLQGLPPISAPLPQPLRPLVANFRSSFRHLVQQLGVSVGAVGSMDELPLAFSAPYGGVPKRQLLCKPELESCHATAVLSCLADGTLLPTMLILKDVVDLPKTDENIIVVQQDKGLMDIDCMLKWLDLVWFRYSPKDSLLVADSYDPHCVTEVMRCFNEGSVANSHVMLIPAGCSFKLQPLDATVKSTFQHLIDQRWESLNLRVGATWACGQQLRLPTAKEMLEWVKDAHYFIKTSRQETLRRSFVITGLLGTDNLNEEHFLENLSFLPSEEDLPHFGVK